MNDLKYISEVFKNDPTGLEADDNIKEIVKSLKSLGIKKVKHTKKITDKTKEGYWFEEQVSTLENPKDEEDLYCLHYIEIGYQKPTSIKENESYIETKNGFIKSEKIYNGVSVKTELDIIIENIKSINGIMVFKSNNLETYRKTKLSRSNYSILLNKDLIDVVKSIIK